MAITAEARNEIIYLIVGMFDAAPGDSVLTEMVAAYEGGASIADLAVSLEASAEFRGIYPTFLTSAEFATRLVDNLAPSLAAADKAYAVGVLTAELNAGANRGMVAFSAIKALAAVPETDPNFGAAAAQLNNKVEVATYYTVDKNFSGNSLAELQDVIASVTDDDATVTAAKAEIDDEVNVGGTFTLTAGADTVTGGSGDDTINALSVNAAGTAATTFSAFDSIDGGAGQDTLNIYTDNGNTLNNAFNASSTVANVEIVNIYNANGAVAAFGDASKFTGVEQLWQVGAAAAVTNLKTTTTAGLKNVDANVSVTPAAGAASATIALSNYGEGRTLTVDGSATTSTLATVNVSGTVKDTDANGSVAATTLAVTAGKNATSLAVNTAVKTTLTVTENGNSSALADIRTVDASGSTGAVTYDGTVTGGTAGAVSTIKGGTGADTLTIVTATVKDNGATAADETVSALVEGGAGKDNITINTTGTGTTTVNAGDDADTVTLTADGSGKLTVNLGAGDDVFKGAGAVSGTDVIDGGEGNDSLLLNMVGAANIGAFSNFEKFDAAALAKTLDVDILAAKNTVTEFVASADVGAGATLINLGAGVGYRVIGDTAVANAMTLTQKTAGALTVTLDIDETTAANSVSTSHDAAVVASNATSLKTVFDSAFVGAAAVATDNQASLTATGTKATTLEIVSGGANASNTLLYTGGQNAGGTADLLTAVTVTGDRAVNFDYTAAVATSISSVDASAATGALTFDLADLKAAGTVKLGSGDDAITAQAGAATGANVLAAARSLEGIEKGSAEGLTLQSNFDVVKLAGAVQAADVAATATHTVKDGLFTFNGAGPATLEAAVTSVAGVIGANEAVVFEYIGNSYIYAEGATDGGADDVVIKLTGVTGLSGLDDVAAGSVYVF